jgi:hypothetical protein
MKKTGKGFEFETEETIFSRGQHRKVIVIFAPPNRLGFRLMGDHITHWLTSGACFDLAVKAGSRHTPGFSVKELIEKATKTGDDLLPFQ